MRLLCTVILDFPAGALQFIRHLSILELSVQEEAAPLSQSLPLRKQKWDLSFQHLFEKVFVKKQIHMLVYIEDIKIQQQHRRANMDCSANPQHSAQAVE